MKILRIATGYTPPASVSIYHIIHTYTLVDSVFIINMICAKRTYGRGWEEKKKTEIARWKKHAMGTWEIRPRAGRNDRNLKNKKLFFFLFFQFSPTERRIHYCARPRHPSEPIGYKTRNCCPDNGILNGGEASANRQWPNDFRSGFNLFSIFFFFSQPLRPHIDTRRRRRSILDASCFIILLSRTCPELTRSITVFCRTRFSPRTRTRNTFIFWKKKKKP